MADGGLLLNRERGLNIEIEHIGRHVNVWKNPVSRYYFTIYVYLCLKGKDKHVPLHCQRTSILFAIWYNIVFTVIWMFAQLTPLMILINVGWVEYDDINTAKTFYIVLICLNVVFDFSMILYFLRHYLKCMQNWQKISQKDYWGSFVYYPAKYIVLPSGQRKVNMIYKVTTDVYERIRAQMQINVNDLNLVMQADHSVAAGARSVREMNVYTDSFRDWNESIRSTGLVWVGVRAIWTITSIICTIIVLVKWS